MNACQFMGRISSDIDYRVNGDKGIARFSIAAEGRIRKQISSAWWHLARLPM